MILYGSDLSPFAARCRMQFLVKDLDVEFLPAPGGLKSDEYKKINPIQRIPALVTDDGACLPESEIICEYIEDLIPEPSLRPSDPAERALMRALSRITDLYYLSALGPLFGQMKPETRDAAIVDKALEATSHSFGFLEHYIGEKGFAAGDALSLADCTLVSAFNLTLPFLGRFGMDEPLRNHPKLDRYWTTIQTEPAAGNTIARMQTALAKARAEGRMMGV